MEHSGCGQPHRPVDGYAGTAATRTHESGGPAPGSGLENASSPHLGLALGLDLNGDLGI